LLDLHQWPMLFLPKIAKMAVVENSSWCKYQKNVLQTLKHSKLAIKLSPKSPKNESAVQEKRLKKKTRCSRSTDRTCGSTCRSRWGCSPAWRHSRPRRWRTGPSSANCRWTAWCGPCRSFAPTYEKVAGKYPDIVFAKVDTEVEQGLATTFNIMSIPTLMIIRENVVIFSQAGALPERALDELVEKVRDLDMQEVHRQVLEQQNANS